MGIREGGTTNGVYAILHKFVVKGKTTGTGFVGYPDLTILEPFQELHQRMVGSRDATVEYLFTVCPGRDMPAVFVDVDTDRHFLARNDTYRSRRYLFHVKPPCFFEENISTLQRGHNLS
jgi:hypothetical protein